MPHPERHIVPYRQEASGTQEGIFSLPPMSPVRMGTFQGPLGTFNVCSLGEGA